MSWSRLPSAPPNFILYPPAPPDSQLNGKANTRRRGAVKITAMTASTIEPVELVRLIHASPTRVCAVVTGGGVLSLAWLFGEPGASRTFLDAQIPYSMRALDEYVGVDAEQHVSPLEADRMATAALTRGRHLAAPDDRVAGVSLHGPP